MKKGSRTSSRRVGLDIGLAVGRFFLNTEDLHYGYWPKNKEATIQNLAVAQETHSQFIIDHIPKKSRSILDVGSGSGNLALKLLNLGYKVNCVIPSEFLAEQVAVKLSDKSKIYICEFEKVDDLQKYDLILFSESFQYVKMKESLEKIIYMLSSNGHLLICDFFRRAVPEKGPMGGGHSWKQFQEIIVNHPLKLVTDIDITNETSPTIDLFAKFNTDVAAPIAEMSGEYLIDNYPNITKLFKWKFKKRLEKIHDIYLSGNVNGESFKKFKKYHLLVYKKKLFNRQ